jgi:hypothetical protein
MPRDYVRNVIVLFHSVPLVNQVRLVQYAWPGTILQVQLARAVIQVRHSKTALLVKIQARVYIVSTATI